MPGAAENRYCNVQVRAWDDPDVQRLSKPPPNAQTLWWFLLHGPYTTPIPGVISGGRAAMAEALDWPIEDFDRCFGEIAAARPGKDPMAVADWKARLVYLPGAFKLDCNKPTSTNMIVRWRNVMNDLAECELLYRIDDELRALLRNKGEQGFLDAYSRGKRGNKKQGSTVDPTADSKPLPRATPDPDPIPDPVPDPVPIPRSESGARARVDEVPSREPTTTATPASSAEVVLREWNALPGAPPFEDEAKIAPLAEAVRKLQAVSPEPIRLPELLGALYRVGKRMSDDGRQQVWQASTLVKHLQEAVLVARGQVKPEERSRAGPKRIDPLKGQMPIVHFNLDKG